MERVTTFKLCFLLGVPEYKLRKDFPVEWRLASRIRYFDSMSAVLEYRDISLAYFAVLSRYKECSAEISMLHVLKDCGVSNISRVFPSSTESLLEFTNRLASRRNELLAAAYSELHIQIPMDIMMSMLMLSRASSVQAAQLRFLLSHNSNPYGIYFPDRELLNVCVLSMFHDDLSLRDRLSLFIGQRVERIYDDSILGETVRSYVQDVYLSAETVRSYSKIYAYNGYTSRLLDLKRYLSSADLEDIPITESLDLDHVHSGALVISNDCRWVVKAAKRYDYLDFAVVMPVEPYFYRNAKERLVENIYLVSS